MEIGIDSFIATGAYEGALNPQQNIEAIEALLSKIEHADKMGLHVFGLGEHHRKEFLDEAPAVILAAAAARTKNIAYQCSNSIECSRSCKSFSGICNFRPYIKRPGRDCCRERLFY